MPKPSKQTRSGSTMSSKQLARSVTEGRKIVVHTPLFEEPISGYLCGMDDYHLLVVDSGCTKFLIHKSSALIEMNDLSTYESETLRESLESVIAPFRSFVLTEFFGRTDSPASTERAAV